MRGGPKGFVIRLDRRTKLPCRARQIDVADLFRPDVVFRHEHEPAENAQPAWRADAPAGFFKNLAMQRGHR